VRRLLPWLLAIIITLVSAAYQRLTGPTYDLRGKIIVAGERIQLKLPRSHDIISDCQVAVEAPGPEISGRLKYKRYKTSDAWAEVAMTREDGKLVGYLPRQPMAGKLAYRVYLKTGAVEFSLSGEEPVIIRFKGVVPTPVRVAHIVFMFLAMLFSTRAGLAALDRKSHPRKLVLWTVAFLFIGGFVFGPIIQKYANKTFIAMAGWVVALVAGRKGRPARGWTLAASILMLVIFLVPHSLLGSELKYVD
jgi:hypothetical protein